MPFHESILHEPEVKREFVSEACEQLADLVNRVAYRRERIFLGRRGQKIAVIVSAEDLELLEALEDAADLRTIAEVSRCVTARCELAALQRSA